ncbi:hypothetical protein [Brevundimonas sp. GCM10030266]|uniref:hypothetical protein n=1 Tax=Brevundimonas sp. GCM10030266 TaxID=3273386 RepID=UPI00362184E7
MLVMIGGPVLAVVGLVAATALGEGSGVVLGNTLQVFFGSLIAGGVLRLLVSIDARLEARS